MTQPARVSDESDRDAALREAIRQSPFPLFLVRLSDAQLLEVSRPMEVWAERSRTDLVGRQMLEFVVDADTARRSLALLASGRLDAYTRHALYQTPSGQERDVEIRMSAYVEESPRRTAVGIIMSDGGAATPDELRAANASTGTLVLGTVDGGFRIDRITNEVTDLLGYTTEQVLCSSAFQLVHPEDVSSLLLLAAHASGRPSGSCGRARFLTAAGDWVLCRLVVQPLAGASVGSYAFALSPLGDAATLERHRVRELEEHLRRIAREIAASGVAAWSAGMPTSLEVPELSLLSTREYEIVARLAAGERVPAIARGLFLSESTVRNHLTSVYRKFTVHSQVDLLARLHSLH